MSPSMLSPSLLSFLYVLVFQFYSVLTLWMLGLGKQNRCKADFQRSSFSLTFEFILLHQTLC